MANLGNYDATGGQTMQERTALPAGKYMAALVKSDRQESKKGNGNAYINCEFEVMDGEAKGRRFWTLLNLWNDNTTAVDIAQRELNSIMHACGKLRIADTEDLHGIPMMVTLKVKTDSYGDKNEVAKYEPMNAGFGQQSHQQTAQTGTGGGAPWRK